MLHGNSTVPCGWLRTSCASARRKCVAAGGSHGATRVRTTRVVSFCAAEVGTLPRCGADRMGGDPSPRVQQLATGILVHFDNSKPMDRCGSDGVSCERGSIFIAVDRSLARRHLANDRIIFHWLAGLRSRFIYWAGDISQERCQWERIICVLLLSSLPVALLALLELYGLAPSHFATRRYGLTSFAGGPVFLGGYMLMLIPLSFWKLHRCVQASNGKMRVDAVH